MITDGVNGRASDIHVEPMADRVRLRYRVDGVCHERDNLPKRMQSSIIARLKIMAGMNIRRIAACPQDGRIEFEGRKSRKVDLRVSSLPHRTTARPWSCCASFGQTRT